MINLIWAMDKNWLIGKDNKLPWHYKEDLVYYKEKTRGKVVLMGDKTYLSLMGYYKDKPLPYEKVYVATIDDISFDGAIMVRDINAFLKDYKDELWVVGGKTIYKLSLPYADRLYITHIDKEYEGDTYFPKFNLDDYSKISQNDSGELSFCIYERK